MKKYIIYLLTTWAFLALPVYLTATTYYVDVNGSDQAAGTQAAPWKTCSKVNVAASTSDVIHFNVGTFGANQNDTTLVIPASGIAGANSIFEGAGADLTTITAAAPKSLWGAGTGWEPFGAVAKTHYHLIAKDDSIFAMWKRTTGVNDSILTRVMTATPTTHQRFCVRTAAGATLDTVVVFFNAAVDTTNITRSKTRGIYSTGKSYFTIQNMRITKGTGVASGAPSSNLYAATSGREITITKCVFDSAGNTDVTLVTRQTALSYNKFMSANGIYAIADSGYIYNNVFTVTTNGFNQGLQKNWVIKNNIFSGQTKFILIIAAGPYAGSNNLFYHATSYTNRWSRGSTNFSTLASWQDSTGQEANSLTGDPLFFSTTDANYHIFRTSPAYNAGTALGYTTDFDGNKIRGLPDIGAYEAAVVKRNAGHFYGVR